VRTANTTTARRTAENDDGGDTRRDYTKGDYTKGGYTKGGYTKGKARRHLQGQEKATTIEAE
jgi:hypothetical protein